MQSPDVLHRILVEAHEARIQKQPFLTVFDLDSTLFDLSPRISEIVRAFASEPLVRAKYAELCRQLQNLAIEPRDWGLREALERLGIFEKEHPEFYRELHEYWAARFFSNDYLEHDLPVPGAVEFVQELQSLGSHIWYLTGRDVARMEKGTIASLLAWKFPLAPPQSKLILKPEAKLDDAAFKLTVMEVGHAQFPRLWLFENEPVNLHLIQTHLPDVGLVFIDTTHSGREQPRTDLTRIPHFETNLAEFRRYQTRSR